MSDQMHGKTFENLVKASNHDRFKHSTPDRARRPDERFDISAEDDIKGGIPTSIKTTGGGTVGLSGAVQFWQSLDDAPYRILVGCYRQEDNRKIFDTICEFIVKPAHRQSLLGEISLKEVEEFHNGLKEFEKGRHQEAREWAKQHKASLSPKAGYVMLNPKIDSKTQRRLQCSIGLDDLGNATGGKIEHTKQFGTLALPLHLVSNQRRFRAGE